MRSQEPSPANGPPELPGCMCRSAACHAGAVEREQGCRPDEPMGGGTRKKGDVMSLKEVRAARESMPQSPSIEPTDPLSPPAEGCLASGAEKDGSPSCRRRPCFRPVIFLERAPVSKLALDREAVFVLCTAWMPRNGVDGG